MTEDDWLSVIAVHLNGSFFVSRAAAEHYRKQESGTFVHISSTSGLIGNFGQANYSAAKLGITALSKSIALDMQRYNVRSNCIAPFAWSRMTQSIPASTPEQQARLAKIQAMTPDKNAPMAVFLSSDAAKDVTGQVFGTRMNEIILFSSPRPIRIVHKADGWTPEDCADHRRAGAEIGVHAAGSLRRGVRLGSGLIGRHDRTPPRFVRQLARASAQAADASSTLGRHRFSSAPADATRALTRRLGATTWDAPASLVGTASSTSPGAAPIRRRRSIGCRQDHRDRRSHVDRALDLQPAAMQSRRRSW